MHRRMTGVLMVAGVVAVAGVPWGCREAPPPPRVPIPSSTERDSLAERDYVKPLPPLPPLDQRRDLRVRETTESVPPPREARRPTASSQDDRFSRVQRDFVDAYHRVGQPRFTVLATRDVGAQASVRPVEVGAVENRLSEWLSADAQVVVLSSTVARQRLPDEQAKDVRDGRPQALSEFARELGADVLVHVQAGGGETAAVRLVAEAVNVKGGQSIARGMVEMQSPLDAYEIDSATRNLAGTLMADMIRTWTAPPAEPPTDAPAPVPAVPTQPRP